MGSGVWLRLLLALGALRGLGARETVLGTLGEATFLRIPRKLREHTREFGEATWKRFPEGQQTKKFLLKLSGGNYTEYEPGRMRFHSQDFSLEILNTSRDDRQLYEYSVSSGEEEEVWQILLEVFEAVAAPSIRILAWELSNGSCSVALRCSSERGDDVSYSWAGLDGGSGSGPCSGSGAFLNLSFPQRSSAPRCSCTASNRVSSRRAALQSPPCASRQRGDPAVRTELLALLVALGLLLIVIVIVTVTVVTVALRGGRSAKRDRDPPQAAPDSAGATIYAQVQKPRAAVPTAPAPSCATIYAAATAGAPRHPPPPPGTPQEPTTVYASVMLPAPPAGTRR